MTTILRICSGILAFAVICTAHPLGNFSVNQYSRLEVEMRRIKIRYVLDLAEIPTFQEQMIIDRNRDGTMAEDELETYVNALTPLISSNLILLLNDESLQIKASKSTAKIEIGVGNLPTLKIFWDFVAEFPPDLQEINKIVFENKNFSERIGWNEIVVNHENRIQVFNSTAYGDDITDELKVYPQETLDTPLQEKRAEFFFTTGDLPENAEPLQNRNGYATVGIQKDRLAELIAIPEVAPIIIFFGLLIAFGLGALHALSPGHGKAIVGAYLVGSRGTFKHAVFLGVVVTITHTIGVFVLGFITLFASEFVFPERIMPFLQFVSGLMVFFIGVSLFKSRLFNALGLHNHTHFPHYSNCFHHHDHSHGRSNDCHDHYVHHEDHDHRGTHRLIESGNYKNYTTVKHSHNESSVKITQDCHIHCSHSLYEHHRFNSDHCHCHLHDFPVQKEAKVKTSHNNLIFTHTHDGITHSHFLPEEISFKSLLGIGVSGGLLPCPSALVLMLSAISLGRIGYGLILTVAFSLGLGTTLTIVGLVFLYLGKVLGSFSESCAFKFIPVFSALLITFLGALICYRSF
jgi:nickel/cobalt exporter